jgi:haloalkane dehalogenase
MKRAYADVPFGQLHYRELGTGEPVLFLHKTPSSSVQFERTAPFIAREGFRVIALDSPGFGLSDAHQTQPTMADYGLAVHQFLDAIGVDRTAICGHHTGGSLALEAVGQRPERFTKVIFGGILAVESDAEREELKPYLNSYAWQPDAKGDFLEIYPKRPLGDWLTEDDPEQYLVEATAYLEAGPLYWWAYEGVRHHHPYDLFPKLTMPTLYLNQDEGRCYERTIRAHKATPGSEYLSLPGTSEGCMDDPEAFARAVVAFLKK